MIHTLQAGAGPRENGFRPAIDPLFRSGASAYGHLVIGVLLSGTLDDGTLGSMMIKSRGGIMIVQDPKDAAYGEMPQSAIENTAIDHIVAGKDIASLLLSLAELPAPANEPVAAGEQRPETALGTGKGLEVLMSGGPPTPFTCPA